MPNDNNNNPDEPVNPDGPVNLGYQHRPVLSRNFNILRLLVTIICAFILPLMKLLLTSVSQNWVVQSSEARCDENNGMEWCLTKKTGTERESVEFESLIRDGASVGTTVAAIADMVHAFYYLMGNCQTNEFTNMENFAESYFITFMYQSVVFMTASAALTLQMHILAYILVLATLEVFCLFSVTVILGEQRRVTREWYDRWFNPLQRNFAGPGRSNG